MCQKNQVQNLPVVNVTMKHPHVKNSRRLVDMRNCLIVCFLSLTLELKRHVVTRPPCQKTIEAFRGPAIKINMHGKIITVDFIYNCTKPCRNFEAGRWSGKAVSLSLSLHPRKTAFLQHYHTTVVLLILMKAFLKDWENQSDKTFLSPHKSQPHTLWR